MPHSRYRECALKKPCASNQLSHIVHLHGAIADQGDYRAIGMSVA